MAYSIIQPPFTLKFREMSKADLKSYFEWFMKVMPERLVVLKRAVRESPSYSSWTGDFSPDSLDELGEWLEGQVATQSKTQEELEEVKAKLVFPVEVSGDRLTNRTLSLTMDIGMYFSQVILNNLDGTRWNQALNNEKFADYGQPVIMGFGTVPLNPVRIVRSTAYGIAGGKKACLRELYDTWAKMKKT